MAIGFGSQALVKDIITGLFILMEDQIAVGDVVDVGKDHAGVVEAITVRTIRLRDQAGTVHTVPFSEVTTVKNLTRDFAYVVARITISSSEDIDRVVEYKTMKFGVYSNPLWQSLQHVVNHGTYHRGQVATMLRQLGATPNSSDLIFFYRERAAKASA